MKLYKIELQEFVSCCGFSAGEFIHITEDLYYHNRQSIDKYNCKLIEVEVNETI